MVKQTIILRKRAAPKVVNLLNGRSFALLTRHKIEQKIDTKPYLTKNDRYFK